MNKPQVAFIEGAPSGLLITLAEPFLDVTTHEAVYAAIDGSWREGVGYLLFDCRALEFIDSSGVGLLVGLHRRLGAGRIRLRQVRPAIRSVFRLLCLEDLFTFE
jgi:anti-anti-sigma factor